MFRNHHLIAVLILPALLAMTLCLSAQETETPVPQGKLEKFEFQDSKIFPGTTRDVWVYVPAQYTETKPACVAAFCDGRSYINPKRSNYVPAIFDKLIHEKAMPITIGVFVNPGVVPSPNGSGLPRFNRSYEYDGLGDSYARFLETELFPHIQTKFNLKLSDDPNDRLVGGGSSGGVCAFNCAWSRPDLFRRVWCTVGTFVGLRGGDELHSLVRKTEAKPIRIFLHDGSNDLNIYAGDWWMANQQMQRALQWMGYEHEFIWDETGHGRAGEQKYLADAMRYLWKNHPEPIKTHPENAGKRRGNFILPNEDWELVSEGHRFTEGPVVNENGELFFSDIQKSTIHKVALNGTVITFASETGKANGLAFTPEGELIACANGNREIVSYDRSGNKTILAKNVSSNDVCVCSDGTIYFTNPHGKKIHRITRENREKQVAETLDDDFPGCNGILLSPDQTQLYVTNFLGRMVTAFQIQPDGKLFNKQPYYWLHLPYRTEKSSLDGMTVDTEGWLYVTSKLGVQICDQAGRVNFIITMPPGERHPANLCFGGEEMNYLYATCGSKVFRRKLSKTGLRSWKNPITPKKPQL